jgi:hypothetical protein
MQDKFLSPFPKWLKSNPTAQGCEERATLGQLFKQKSTPTGLHRLGIIWFNPFRVAANFVLSPGVALLRRATPGWMIQSLWDCSSPKLIRLRRATPRQAVAGAGASGQ